MRPRAELGEVMKGRLWVLQRRGGQRLHSQLVSFTEWPRVMGCFVMKHSRGSEWRTDRVEDVSHDGEVVRFSTRSTHYELEKRPD